MKTEVRIETRESKHQLFHLCMPNSALQAEMQANDDNVWLDYTVYWGTNVDGHKEDDESSVQDSLYSKNGVRHTTGGRAAQRN